MFLQWIHADFNGDNITDLVTANQFSDDVSVMLGTGTGSFSSAINYSAGWSPKSVAVGDYNEDMILDLATANSATPPKTFFSRAPDLPGNNL